MKYTNHRSFALEQDKKDILKKFQSKFHIPKDKNNNPIIYFAGNSLGLQPVEVQQSINNEIERWKTAAVEAHHSGDNPWYSYHELLTDSMAKIVGAKPHEVVTMNALTVNLHLLLVSFFQPNNKRKKIMIEHRAFPSDRYAVLSQLNFHNLNQKQLIEVGKNQQEYIIKTDTILEAIEQHKNELAVILIGGVNYFTGQKFEIKKITEKAHEYNIIVGFDLAHAAGNVELKLHDWNVDFAAWCSYKYLNGGPGNHGSIFIHSKHLNNPNIKRFEGWWGHNKKTRFLMPNDFDPIISAEAWQLSNPSILALATLKTSLNIFNQAGIDVLIKKSNDLTGYLAYLLKNEIPKVKIITPINYKHRGAQLSLQIEKFNKTHLELLKQKNIICDFREPNIFRIAPTPLYNSYIDVYQFVMILKKIIYA